jgi:hypothetical protein
MCEGHRRELLILTMSLPVVCCSGWQSSQVDGGIPELDEEVSWEEVHEEIVPELVKKAGSATEALVLLFNHA